MPEQTKKKILFLDKVLTKPLKEDRLRGVEVFNVFFLKDLIKLGHRVTLIIHPTWQETMDRELPSAENLTIIHSSEKGGKVFGSLVPLWKIRKQKFDSLFLANVGNGILVPYHFIQCHKMVEKTALLAHKVPGRFFVNNLKKDTIVVSVNTTIAKPFEVGSFPVNDVYYGILNTKQFYPPETPRNDGKIKFGMLGDLDSDWKGSDTAIEAFLQLPEEIAEKAELHLAAFTQKNPDAAKSDNRIKVYNWIERDQVGDYLRSLDVMLCLSREIDGNMMETFCQTMVQGMLCGLPQITTELEIFKEKLDEGGGIVTHSVSEVKQAMIQLSESNEQRDSESKQAAQVATDRYVWNSEYFTEKYL